MSGYASMTRKELIAELEALQRKVRRDPFETVAERDAGRLFERIVEQAPFGILVAANSTGRIFFANDEACRINGVSREALLNFSLLGREEWGRRMQFSDGRPMRVAETPLARAVLQGQPTHAMELCLERADGRQCRVLCSARPLYDENNHIFSGMVSFVELTDQDEEFPETLRDEGMTIDAYYKADMQGRLVFANPATARILGYDTPQDILGKDIASSFYADPQQRAEFLEELYAKEFVSSYRLQLRQADGTPVVVETSSRLIASSSGAYAGVEGLFRDVTQRVQAEEQLRRSEYFYRRLFENTGAATVLIDSQGLIRRANTQSLELGGYSRDEVEGKMHWYQMVEPDDLCWMLEFNQRRNSDGPAPPREYDFTMIDKQGNRKFVHGRIDFLQETRERIVSMVDMTARITLEKQMEEMNQHLERLVAERTEALEKKNEELENANQRLLELDEVKSNLLSSVSHELRTPLTSIMGFAKVTRNAFDKYFSAPSKASQALESRAKTVRGNLEIIAREGERLTRLINDLLDLSRVESGEFRWKDERFNVSEVLFMAVDIAFGEFQNRPDVEFTVSLPKDLPDVVADKDKLQQVLLNLLNNAAKFTEKGEVVLSAKASKGWVEISVADTGIGIPEQLQDRIFDKFYTVRSDDTLQSNIVGTGLGLALCSQVVEHYQGEITVTSSPGHGSVFVVSLPVAE